MIEKIKNIAQLISSQGGTSMLIGGAVIDSILGLPIKDIDIEVYGLSLQEVESLLVSNGIPTNMVGKSFGVIKVVSNDVEFDISIPRRENKSGFGHNHFEISLDHNMSPKEAGLRRDLTINSMYQNILTDEIIDPFNGLQDLKDGVIRATNKETFKEDPLRVLRIMQLLPRKGKFVHPDTIKLCQDMFHEFTHLPKERVFAEFEKLLLKADKPSKGLEFLKECGWISHFPELEELIGCQQHPEWHPEGDVWIHTCLVLDNAAQLRHNVPDELKLSYMFSALLHDIGKPGTTDIHLKSPGHDVHGAKLT